MLISSGNFDKSNKLGEGSFAIVYKGHAGAHRNQLLQAARDPAEAALIAEWPAVVAIKVDKKKEVKGEDGAKAEAREAYRLKAEAEEILVCSKYRHRFMCSLLGGSVDGPTRCLVFEHCPGGSIKERMRGTVIDARTGKPFPPLTWEHRLRLAAQTCSALEYLHVAGTATQKATTHA